MLAAAETDLDPDLVRPGREERARIGDAGGIGGKARRRELQQPFLPRPQRVAPAPAIEPVGDTLDGRVMRVHGPGGGVRDPVLQDRGCHLSDRRRA